MSGGVSLCPYKVKPALVTCTIITFPSSGPGEVRKGNSRILQGSGFGFYSSVSRVNSFCTPGTVRGFISAVCFTVFMLKP